jgi:hypothetical protein
MKIIIVMLLSCLSVMAQESSDLKQKYGVPQSEIYLMRPDVYLTVTHAKNGQVCEMLISPETPTKSLNGRTYKTFGSKVLSGLIDELVPINQRGKFIKGGVMNVNCLDCSYSGDVNEYESVVIFRAKSAQKNQERYAEIRWKSAACEE